MFQERAECAVVVPAYGEPQYLEETLISLVKTQSESVRILVLDDGSKSSYIENLVKNFEPRINYLHNSKNLGVSNNFNKALNIVNSRFVMLVGPDDLMTSCMTLVVNNAKDFGQSPVAILSRVRTINSLGKTSISLSGIVKSILTPKSTGCIPSKRFLLTLLIGNWVFNPSVVWDTDQLDDEPYSDQYLYCMDWDLLLKLAYANSTCFYTTINVFSYRRHSQSISMINLKGRYSEELKVLNENYLFANRHNILFYTLTKLAIMPRLNLLIRKIQTR